MLFHTGLRCYHSFSHEPTRWTQASTFFFPSFVFLSFSSGSIRLTDVRYRMRNFDAVSFARWIHTCGYKCAREAPSRVHEGGLQGDITRRRKACVSLPQSADAALALMFPTSDAKTNKTVYMELQ